MACDELKTISITKGEKSRVIDIFLTTASTCRPYDLTGVTELTLKFPGTTTTVVKQMTVGSGVLVIDNAKLGHIQTTLTEANITALKEGKGQDILIWIEFGATVLKKTLLKGTLDVLKESFA